MALKGISRGCPSKPDHTVESVPRVVLHSLDTRKSSPPLATLNFAIYPVGSLLERKLFLRIIMDKGIQVLLGFS